MDDMLQVEELSGGYFHKNILKNISFTVSRGEMFGILGPNGSGKSTLLKMISSLLPYQSGQIKIDNRSLQTFSTKELAKLMAVLPQISSETFPFSVKQTVKLGRYAHQRGLFHSWSREDESVVQEVMALTKINGFQGVSLQDLSGGERQRVFLAQALAQEPNILILDEPTNHLDLSHQKGLLDHLKSWTRKRDLTVVTVFHDLNLAALYCDRLLLLDEGEVIHIGTPEEVLNEQLIQRVYKTVIEKHSHPEVPRPNMVLIPETEKGNRYIDESYLSRNNNAVMFQSPIPLKTIASASTGSGIGWKEKFIVANNRTSTEKDEKSVEMQIQNDERIFIKYSSYHEDEFSIFFVLSADRRLLSFHTWLFINGRVDESTLIEAMATVLEAKEKVLKGESRTNGSDDGIVVAVTQHGKKFPSARPSSDLGKSIFKGMSDCTETLFNHMNSDLPK